MVAYRLPDWTRLLLGAAGKSAAAAARGRVASLGQARASGQGGEGCWQDSRYTIHKPNMPMTSRQRMSCAVRGLDAADVWRVKLLQTQPIQPSIDPHQIRGTVRCLCTLQRLLSSRSSQQQLSRVLYLSPPLPFSSALCREWPCAANETLGILIPSRRS